MSNNLKLGNFEAIRLVAAREVRERLRAKSYYFLTAILVVLIIGIGVAGRFTGGGTVTLELGIVGDDTALAASATQVAEASGIEITTETFPDRGIAEAALNSEEVNAILAADGGEAIFSGEENQQYLAVLQQAWNAAQGQSALVDAGLTPEQIGAALNVSPLTTTVVNEDSEGNFSSVAIATGTIAAILLFISLQTFGSYVLMGVVEEKSTAVVEVLMARITAGQMLAGKVIGIGIPALIQFALAVGAGLVSLSIADIDVPPEIWSAVPTALLWFLGGYAFYSTLFALAGSLVSRQEDAGAASAPIQTALIGAYMLVFAFGYRSEGTLTTVLSLFPASSPLIMPLRMANGTASILEVIVALALLALATVIAWAIASRIYERVLLQRGSRISWKAAFGLLRSAK